MPPRDERYISTNVGGWTPKEGWREGPNPGHWYEASTAFSLGYLGSGVGRSCLVIGSPVFEYHELTRLGWDATYLDIRDPPKSVKKSLKMSACDMRLPDESFDAVSSACVLTHAGLGRYGDDKASGHDDESMLRSIVRVLKTGCPAALTFGACVTAERMIRLGSAHRIYTIEECKRMLSEVNLKIEYMKIWSHITKTWTLEPPTEDLRNPDYISFAVVKCSR